MTSLNHEEPDRVPIDLGSTCVTSIAASTYQALRRHIGLSPVEPRISELVQQIAWVDQDVLDVLGVDVVPVWPNAPSGYCPSIVDEGEKGSFFKDEFGAILRKPKDGFYYDWTEFPLAQPSMEALDAMAWPDPDDPGRYVGLRKRTLKLRQETDYALFGMAPCGHDLLNQLFRVRGMVEAMTDFLLHEDFVEAFLERLTRIIMRAQERFLDEVGDLLDVHFAADDLAGQSGPLISPLLFRKHVKPRWARIVSLIKSKTRAKVFFHSCGAVREFIPDLIEIGVDIINPVQVSAAGMDSAALTREFGRSLSFWGGGCDTQSVLPFGTPAEVREEVKRRIRDFAPGGGFVFNPVHNVQPNVPPENIAAAFKAAAEFGSYPALSTPGP